MRMSVYIYIQLHHRWPFPRCPNHTNLASNLTLLAFPKMKLRKLPNLVTAKILEMLCIAQVITSMQIEIELL